MSPTRSRRPSNVPKAPRSERRLAVRAPLELPVHLKNPWLTSEARSVDVSTSGMLVVQNRLASGEDDPIHLMLDFTLPGQEEPVRAMARPVWSRGPFRAFKFLTVSDADRLSIAEHVDRYARRAESPRATSRLERADHFVRLHQIW